MTSVSAHRQRLAAAFRRFAEVECPGNSPLYQRLASAIAEDDDMLALAGATPKGQPAPNLLLGAVQYLLLAGLAHPLAGFYPSLGGEVEGDPWPALRDCALTHADAIAAQMRARRVQTNEVGRCAALLPAFGAIARRAERPIAMIELGASAGLNLLWDHYAYDYGDAGTWQSPSPAGRGVGVRAARERGTELRLASSSRAASLPLPPEDLAIAWRVGIDLNPIDVCDNDAVRWLEALIWPDQATRLARLRGAVAIAREDPPRVLAGDASVLVAEAMAEAPEGTALCVYHTFAIYQFPAEARARLTAALIQASHSRGEVFDLDMSGVAGGHAELRLTRYRNGQPEEALLARCGPHGQWIEWLTWNARTDVSSHGGCR